MSRIVAKLNAEALKAKNSTLMRMLNLCKPKQRVFTWKEKKS